MEIFLLDKQTIKQLKCAVCLKRKAITITKTPVTGNSLICKPCLDYINERMTYSRENGKEYPTVTEIYDILRK